MRLISIGLLLGLATSPALAERKEPINLRDVGSFHIGGHLIEITGQPVKEIVFTRLGDPRMKERAFLEPFTGSYLRGPTPIAVAMKGDHAMTVTLPGQGALELEPVKETRFNIKGMTGFSVEFKGDDLIFYQPNGTFVATRNK